MAREELFYWIMNMGILGSALLLLILLLRRIKWIPKGFVALLWAVPIVRLLVPVAPSSSLSLLNMVRALFPNRVRAVAPFYVSPTSEITKMQVLEDSSLTAMNLFSSGGIVTDTSGSAAYKAFGQSTPVLIPDERLLLIRRIFSTASTVWLMVTILLLLYFTIGYLYSIYRLRNAKPVGGHKYTRKEQTMPIAVGILRPRIILPEQSSPYDEYIILHEQAHIERKDNLMRLLGLLAAVVHWYNPLSWYFLKTMHLDLEMACDSRVLGRLPPKKQKEYAKAVLSVSTDTSLFSSAFGGTDIRKRILQITAFKNRTKAMTALLTIVFVLFIALTLTNSILY